MVNPMAGVFYVSQTWEQHLANAGPKLGGVDYAGHRGTNEREMPRGTELKAGGVGVLEWVTPATPVKDRPRWYNTGLGYAAAVRYANGCRTVYGHCSGVVGKVGRTVQSGDVIALSGGQKGSVGAGRSTGGHCHNHDVAADGFTRARPFTLLPTTPAGGGDLKPIEEEHTDVKIIQDTSDGKYYRIGETTVLELAPSVAAREASVWGNGIAVDHATAVQVIADANAAGKNGDAPAPTPGQPIDYSRIASPEHVSAATEAINKNIAALPSAFKVTPA